MQFEPFKERVLGALYYMEGMRFERMFRHWGLYHRNHFIGIIAGERFFLRTNSLTRQHYLQLGMQQYDSKDRLLRRFYQVPNEIVEHPRELQSWVQEASTIKYTVPKPPGEFSGT